MSFEIENFFPIYDLLHNQIKSLSNYDESLTASEVVEIINKIKRLDKVGRDMIYVFIRIHSLRNSNSKLLDIPYQGVKLNEKIDNNDIVIDAKFDLRNFPPFLLRMLDRFSTLHLQRINEDLNKK